MWVRLCVSLCPPSPPAEFAWMREQPDGNRVPVKLDFHVEHDIVCSFVEDNNFHTTRRVLLSNTGQLSADMSNTLAQEHKRLLSGAATARGGGGGHSSKPEGAKLMHYLIFWAAKSQDTGCYVAVTSTPVGGGLNALSEVPFKLTVQRKLLPRKFEYTDLGII